MSETQPTALQSSPQSGSRRKGCRTCIGCGCAIFVVPIGIYLFLAVLSWFLPDISQNTAKSLALWPATTIEGSYTKLLDRLIDGPGPYSRGGLFHAVVDEADISRDEVLTATRIITENGFVIILECNDIRRVLSRLPRKGYKPESFGKFSIYHRASSGASAIAWADVGHDTLVAGTPSEVEQVAKIAGGEGADLFASREELRPILGKLSDGAAFGIVIQREANRPLAKTSETVLTGGGLAVPPFAALLSIQALGESFQPLPDGCRQELAFQYGSQMASATVAIGFRGLSILGALEKDLSDTPDNMSVDRNRGLVIVEMTFSKRKCDAALKKQRVAIFRWK